LDKLRICVFVCGMLLFSTVALSGTALAQGSAQQELVGTLNNVRNLLLAIGSVVAAIGYIVASYMWMTSSGSPEQRAKARRYFMDVTFGVFLLFISSYLVQLAQSLVA
jgi:type IV secretory pathway VirB2 component (pilin)